MVERARREKEVGWERPTSHGKNTEERSGRKVQKKKLPLEERKGFFLTPVNLEDKRLRCVDFSCY